jgi:Azurin
MKILSSIIPVAMAFVIGACSGGSSSDSSQQEGKGTNTTRAESKKTGDNSSQQSSTEFSEREMVDKSTDGDTTEVVIHTPGSNLDEMRYDINKLKIRAGQTVKLTLKNEAPKGADEMEHNWVVTKAGKDQEVAAEGVKAGEDNNFLPEDKQDILAYTPIVEQQEEATITFQMDKAGEYPFICTHPEHYPTMKGTLVVEQQEAS